MTSPLDCSHLNYNLARALSLWQTSRGNSLRRGKEVLSLRALPPLYRVLLQAAEPWLNLEGEAGL
jgi:hypothetical protein